MLPQITLQRDFCVDCYLTGVSTVAGRKQEEFVASMPLQFRQSTSKDSNRTFPESRPLCTRDPYGLCRPLLHRNHGSNLWEYREVLGLSVFAGAAFQFPTTCLLFCSVLVPENFSVGKTNTVSYDRCWSRSPSLIQQKTLLHQLIHI
jgi:hypothetical protein